MKTFTLTFVFFLITGIQFVHSQDVLTVEEAIQIGLNNNYGIQLSQNEFEIASNNRTLGNAGFLPAIELSASQTERVEDSKFEAGGESRTTSGARSSVRNAAINLDWTIFDGLQMFAAFDRLTELEKMGEQSFRLDAELLVSQIINSYYNIIRLSEQLNVLQNTVEVSLERIEIEETKVDLGSGSEYELLQARSDLSADRAALIREQNILTEAKITLNQLLSRNPDTDFKVSGNIP
ncbi:MAG: TolC family protein, partial [Balneolaceae bacterium]